MPELTISLDEAFRLSRGFPSIFDREGRPNSPRLAERLRQAGFDPAQPISVQVDERAQECRLRQ